MAILVPPILILLAKHPDVGKYDFSSLREIICGAAPLSAEIARDVSSRLGGTVVKQGYGMTETSPAATIEETHDVLEGKDVKKEISIFPVWYAKTMHKRLCWYTAAKHGSKNH